jgi:hypothetical protein
MPGTDGGEYLLTALFEAGPSEHHAMGGELPLSWQTLDAYARATGAICEPWEFRTLRDMSAAYVAEKEAGKEVYALAPAEKEKP